MWQRNQTSLEDFILEELFDDSLLHLFLFSFTMVVFLIAVSGNSLTILLICADPRLHTPMYFLLSQLSLMDLMHVSTTIPKMAANYLSGKKSISFVGCAVQHFLYLSVGGAECILLALMSYDRYVAICHPLRYSVLMSRKVEIMMAVVLECDY
ncbi:olfactory receptor 2AE1-like [Fukomys damarensis]|uniref:olfactory receptor 2AE1-like n=1 Tax=Fukomys damarensis TaxID=885580 RepID=UPI00145563B5|nr:olfactory receptor 2AE1-like [Fukomys damarensis]